MIPSPLTLTALSRKLPTVDLHLDPLLERARRVLDLAITAFIWATVLTYVAGRCSRRAFEYVRPHLAQLFNQLALLLDGAIAYPDQPEPAPVVVPTTPSRKTRRSR